MGQMPPPDHESGESRVHHSIDCTAAPDTAGLQARPLVRPAALTPSIYHETPFCHFDVLYSFLEILQPPAPVAFRGISQVGGKEEETDCHREHRASLSCGNKASVGPMGLWFRGGIMVSCFWHLRDLCVLCGRSLLFFPPTTDGHIREAPSRFGVFAFAGGLGYHRR